MRIGGDKLGVKWKTFAHWLRFEIKPIKQIVLAVALPSNELVGYQCSVSRCNIGPAEPGPMLANLASTTN
ncbi:hypothetical protein Rvan_0471 [Rhodomicrobium vannielii ATCC 17100]|uniref:Uncharacterized protein n=1 Tax=Rhodomicrobium vannielii (strain ATCC 17100 / DSM 162 / LMG 4299 / NCIMB 10020 / ATH 3.1.1) TaxID=648757 RepID=E3I8C8_RHOVT|nr:hypothetical protein Rvan_0471 [Rhodomicrobium vannielii ATCC 17100]